MKESNQLDKKNIEDIIALTPMQEGMLFHYLKDPVSLQYFEQLYLDISGDIDNRRFERAWHVVINTNEMLRTVFRWKNIEKPMQIILKNHPLKLNYYDCSNQDNSEKRKLIQEVIKRELQEKFVFSHVPFRVTLCKIEKFKYKLIITSHHILYDGWSSGIILNEFFNAYRHLAEGNKVTAPPVKTKFKEYVRWLQTSQIQDRQKQEKFWKDYLKGFDTRTPLTLGKKRVKHGPGTAVAGNESLALEKGITDKLEIFIKENQLTLGVFFYCAWGILLQKYCNTDDVVFGATVSGRSAPIKGIENMVGLFINTLPVRIKTGPGEKVMDLLHQLKIILPTWETYDSTALVDIKRYCGMEVEVGQELFNSLVVIENYPVESRLKRQDSEPFITSYSMWESTHYDIALRISTTDHIALEVIYDNETGDAEIIRRLLDHFKNILASIAENPGKALHDIEMLSEAEKEQLVWDFNDIGSRFPGDKTLHELFEKQVEQTPDNIALVGSKQEGWKGRRVEGKEKSVSCTYNELNGLSHQLAHLLKEKGIQPDTIVGILVERSVEMIVGLLGILKAGGAYLPINPESPAVRAQYMLEDSSAKVLVTTRSLLEEAEKLRRWEGETILLGPITAVSSSSTLTCQVSPANLAYIIYTSGSTGKPKGVPITHANLSPLLHWGYRHLNIDSTDRVVQNLSYYFDWSVWEIFMALTSGASLYMVPGDILLDGKRYVDFINKNGITVLHITPTHFQSLTHREQKLNTLRHLCIGAEKLSVDLVIRSYELVDEKCRVYNMYGPTEATIMAAVLEIDQANLHPYKNLTSVPIGKTLGNNTLLILDRDLNLCPILVTGELFIAGDAVAAGYLNSPELTAEKFVEWVTGVGVRCRWNATFNKKFCGGSRGAVFQKSPPGCRRQKIYKTGDLVRWLPEGDIEFLGRIDHQVKIRGFRIELGEIENQLLSHKDIKEAVVISRPDENGDYYLCAYIIPNRVPGKIPESKKLREYLSNQLPEHMIPSAFVQIEFVPLTPNGKVDQKALPVPQIAIQKNYTPPRNKIEEKLAAVWSGVLGINRESIGIDDNFFQLGGHSLTATQLQARIHKTFDMEIPLIELFISPTVRELALYMEKSAKSIYSSLKPVEKKDYYALSPAQKRLFVLQQKHPINTAYHITGMVALEGKVHQDKRQKVFKALIDRHESLRTSFITENEIPYQKVHSPGKVEFELELYDAGRTKNFILPFDLSQAPLMRVGLIEPPHIPIDLRGHPRRGTYNSQEGKKQSYLLMIDMHHIISDGVSAGILMKELLAFYAGKEQQELKVQYKDFCQWQQEQSQPGQISPQESYWLKQFQTGNDIPVLQLPTDYTRPAEKNFEGSTATFEITKENTRVLKELALKTESTFFMILLAAFNVFISKLSEQEDIVIGIPVSGRCHSDLEGIVGMFVNTLAIRNYPGRGKTFLEFLEEVGENFLNGMENQDYQFEDLVEKIGPPMDAGRNPLFDVMLVLQNMDTETLEIPGLRVTPRPYASEFSKFDITFIAEEKTNSLHFSVSYSTALFKKETIEGFIRCFKKLISVIPDNPGEKLSQIEIISHEEKQQILYAFNDTETDYPQEKTLHRLFVEQSEQTPDRIAIVGNCQLTPGKRADIQLSYRELNNRSVQLAYILKEKGLQRDAIVGLMVERSLEMVIGMMGILKAGGAYMPIDTDCPPTRVNYMLSDSGAKFLVSMEGMVSEVSEVIELSSLPWDSPLERGAPKGRGVSKTAAGSSNLAYVIYTSGSTGQPKGVMVEHRSAVNVVSWFGRTHNLAPGTHVLQMSDYTFDPSVNQVFGTLHRGALLCLISREVLTDMELLRRHIKKHHIHVLNFVPLVLKELLCSGSQLESIRVVLSGGEKLDDPVKDAILAKGYRLYNQYGPTETTIDALVEKCSMDRVTLGKPISNVKCYIVDKDNNLAPIGIPGELYVAGAGVARGYLNNPELTSERFDRDLWDFQDYHDGYHRSYRSNKSYALYKTGDQAKWLPGGNIQFLGRLDYQVKIRGFRIEVEEIEKRLLRLDGITECVVTARETIETMEGNHPGNENQRYLCAYFVSHWDWDTQQLKEYLSGEVPGYMIPQYFVPMELLPLTATGKIDRDALPEPETGKGRIAPANQTEETLVKIWAQVLNVKEEDISMDDNFFQLGGHSLKMTVIASKIHQELNIRVPLQELFSRLSIRELAEYLKEKAKEKYSSITSVEKKEYYPTSSAQKRLYILQQMNLKGTHYNMSWVVIMEGQLQREKLEEIFQRLIKRHESLRTSYVVVEEEPVQKHHGDVDFRVEYYDLATEYIDEGREEEWKGKRAEEKEAGTHHSSFIIHRFIRPFNLSQAPLLRVGLIKIGTSSHIFMIDIHHIAADGASIDILLEEFVTLYENRELPPLKIQYKDYSQWLNNPEEEKARMKSQETYWLRELAGELPVLKIPTDFERPPIQSNEGKTLNFELRGERLDQLREIAIQEEATLYMAVMTIFNILLSRISGQREIIIGVPVAGRQHVDLQHVLGMLVNMLVLRNHVDEDKTFRELLGEVKKGTLKALENQDYLLEDLVEGLAVKRDMSRNPLFDVMFDLQKVETGGWKIRSLKLKTHPFKPAISRFDLSLIGVDRGERVNFIFEYSTKLFMKETIQRFIKYFNELVHTVIENPNVTLSNIEISHELFDKKLDNPQISFGF